MYKLKNKQEKKSPKLLMLIPHSRCIQKEKITVLNLYISNSRCIENPVEYSIKIISFIIANAKR